MRSWTQANPSGLLPPGLRLVSSRRTAGRLRFTVSCTRHFGARERLRALLLAALALSVAPPALSAEPAPLVTVPAVDIDRYAGLWYEIAAIPMWFQRNCLGDTTAHYAPNPDGTIAVLNRCRTRDGADEARGVARIVDTRSNARLEVSFFSILGWRPVWGDYWIVALAPDYSWAVVGGPKRRYGWILARTPALESATLTAIRERLATLGYDPARFEPTQQAAPH
jgi:apolipoprotein D and lipocalin family protein